METTAKTPENLSYLFEKITLMRGNPNVDKFGAEMTSDNCNTPDGRFRFLVGLLLSSETKDPITANAVFKLDRYLPVSEIKPSLKKEIDECEIDSINDNKTHNLTIENVRASSEAAIKEIIREVGFYNSKSTYLKKIADLIDDVPENLNELLALPGIGPKMALLTLKCCYDKVEGIAVDTHMHRICEKLGLAGKPDLAATPEEVRKDLEDWIPKPMWRDINWIIVGFGESFCTAKDPHCTDCLIKDRCYYKGKSKK